MSTIAISKAAQELILARIAEPEIQKMKGSDSLPTLGWARRAYSIDNSGKRTEYGPGFYFSWAKKEELKGYDYVYFKLPNGEELAISPGSDFENEAQWIDEKDGRLTLVNSE